jgi:MarR-like DNA-binding transcriptional regulator SgrR of sgrS sRNA
MARIEVQPRETPAEREDRVIEVDVDEDLSVHAQIIEDWTAPRQNWDFYLREGHDFGRPNNLTPSGLEVQLFHILTYT